MNNADSGLQTIRDPDDQHDFGLCLSASVCTNGPSHNNNALHFQANKCSDVKEASQKLLVCFKWLSAAAIAFAVL